MTVAPETNKMSAKVVADGGIAAGGVSGERDSCVTD